MFSLWYYDFPTVKRLWGLRAKLSLLFRADEIPQSPAEDSAESVAQQDINANEPPESRVQSTSLLLLFSYVHLYAPVTLIWKWWEGSYRIRCVLKKEELSLPSMTSPVKKKRSRSRVKSAAAYKGPNLGHRMSRFIFILRFTSHLLALDSALRIICFIYDKLTYCVFLKISFAFFFFAKQLQLCQIA